MDKLLAPFIYLIRKIFEISYSLTDNYGVSILLLSFVISLLLLPIFIYIEKAKKRDDAIKRRMQPLVDEIKQVYTGQQRYYYLKTLNRQFGYSQFKALVPILSLLVQIPFFIAAYQYLDNLEAIQRVSFGPLADLSEPDHLFGIVNVLPIIMTVVNLLTAWFYTRNGNTSERKQMIVIAGVFLVLLFNLPSGLVLYWTMNNVFAFLRLFVTNREVFKGRYNFTFEIKTTLLSSYLFLVSVMFIAQINWAMEHGFASLPLRLFLGAFGCLILVSLAAPIWKNYRAKFIYVFNQNKRNYMHCLHASLPLSVFVNLILYTVFENNDFLNNTLLFIGACVLLIVLFQLLILPARTINKTLQHSHIPNHLPLVFFIAGIYFYVSHKYYPGEGYSHLLSASLITIVVSQLLYSIFVYNRKPAIKWVAYVIRFIILVLTTIQLLYVAQFVADTPLKLGLFGLRINILGDNTAEGIVKPGLIILGLMLLRTMSDFKISPKAKWVSDMILAALTVTFTTALIFFWHPLMVYASLPSEFDFNAVDIFTKNLHFVLMISGLLCAFFFIVPRSYKPFVLIVFLTTSILSFINSIVIPLDLGSLQIDKFSKAQNLAAPFSKYLLELGIILALGFLFTQILKKRYNNYLIWAIFSLHLLVAGQALFAVHQSKSDSGNDNMDLSQNKIMFSKSEENILFILADGIQGKFIEQMMRENNDLRESYTGFTWYSNSVSVSNYTHTSVPVIMSGTRFYADSLNADSKHDIRYKITDAADSFINKVHANGYSMTSTHMHYSRANYNAIENFIPEYGSKIDELALKNNFKLKTFEVWYNRLWENALLFSSPLFMKSALYNDAEWIIQTDEISQDLDKYNYLKLLVNLSDASSKEPSFIYLHNHSGHNPWYILNDDATFEVDVHPYDNNLWVMQEYARLFNWMREENVFDNTKIIVVSDHGISWGHHDGEISLPMPKNWDENVAKSLDLNLKKYWRLNALLMVKDFNAKTDFTEDNMLMTNADASYIAFNNDYIDSLKAMDQRTVTSFHVDWQGSFAKYKKHPIRNTYHIKDNIFDLNNWTRTK
ncbi:membrane protein insertase YidC [Draconibacterium halophilum]|uniref:Membrane protein insertase YidC n=1 Tax=Draconibacterium halophilum TaxID=2706887 RepID=A0A6C0RI46_9BACT|nr:membrane protein insertase YidC [Draconibacterium halophilum]QIA09716.1 membrane protein insertase YidC [Draconibacterium halophilum]